MNIRGFHKLSTVDFPRNPCSVLFFGGCNFKCPYCHNPSLVKEETPSLDGKELLFQLRKRKKFIRHLCISGGEPTMDGKLLKDIYQLKNEGFSIKLDTNGTNPGMLGELIHQKLIDYIAMDIKTSFDRYGRVAFHQAQIQKVKESVSLIKDSPIEYEFRTTFIKGIVDLDDLGGVKDIVDNSARFRIQRGLIGSGVLDPDFPMDEYTVDEMDRISLYFAPFAHELIKSYSE